MDGVTVHDVVCFTYPEVILFAVGLFGVGVLCAAVIHLWLTRDKTDE